MIWLLHSQLTLCGWETPQKSRPNSWSALHFCFLIRNWSYVATHLVLVLAGATSLKSLRLRRFKSEDDIWQKCSSSKYTSVEGVGFLIWRHTFKMAAMTSFDPQKCCHLVNAHTASSEHLLSSARQFLIYSTFILVTIHVKLTKTPHFCQFDVSKVLSVILLGYPVVPSTMKHVEIAGVAFW